MAVAGFRAQLLALDAPKSRTHIELETHRREKTKMELILF
jgi:hypothetical protein